MNHVASPAPVSSATPDPRQKKRLIWGVLVWVAGWGLAVTLVPLVNSSGLATALKATLNTILLVGFPKLFLVIAVAIMGKPGFAYLKSVLSKHFRRLAPPAEVSRLRYRIGLILLVGMIVLGSLGDYVASDISLRQQYPRIAATGGDLLILLSLFLLGGDFWDKLRALFIRDAKAVFPQKREVT